jgi:hypothetical protein
MFFLLQASRWVGLFIVVMAAQNNPKDFNGVDMQFSKLLVPLEGNYLQWGQMYLPLPSLDQIQYTGL